MYVWSALPRSLNATFRDIANSKSAVRLSAVRDLVRWSSSVDRARCIEQLVGTLKRDTDLEVRAAAALGLADAEAHEALTAVMEAAEQGPPRLRQMALVAVGELATPGFAPALALTRAALSSDAPALRFQALVAASRLMATEELVPELHRALSDVEARLRYVACRIAEERCFDAAKAASAPHDLIERFEELLSDPDASVAIASALVLARRGSPAARTLLIRELNRRETFVHLDDEQAAIDLCAELRLDAARPGLRARAFGGVFGSSSPLAFQARVALARLGDERAVAQILKGLSSWSRALRAQAVAAAGQAKLQAARPRLMQLEREDRRLDRRSLAEAIASIDGAATPESDPQNPLVTPRREY
jgi:HEAT repeat protein